MALACRDAHVPPINFDGLHTEATAIAKRLVRLSNEAQHHISSSAAMLLFKNMKPVSIERILSRLLPKGKYSHEIDWVGTVCKKLPLLNVLEGFDCSPACCEFIMENIQGITSLMQPVRSEKETAVVNEVYQQLYRLLGDHIMHTSWLNALLDQLVLNSHIEMDEALELLISNMAGLIIQCYDAGNGILSNSLLHYMKQPASTVQIGDMEEIRRTIVEVLRFDPPVHNTRRIANTNICLGQIEIKKGEMIVLLLAAANRDEKQFAQANIFDAGRTNNHEHLTFGFGAHHCLARLFSTNMAAATLFYFFNNYPAIRLLEQELQYEPKMNVRLVSRLLMSFS